MVMTIVSIENHGDHLSFVRTMTSKESIPASFKLLNECSVFEVIRALLI